MKLRHCSLFFMVTGAPASGKTTLFGPLAWLLAGRCLVFDVDWLIDAASALSGAATAAPDDVRRQRIESRPPWRLRDVTEQNGWAKWLRENVADQVDSSRCSLEEAAHAVAGWVRLYL